MPTSVVHTPKEVTFNQALPYRIPILNGRGEVIELVVTAHVLTIGENDTVVVRTEVSEPVQVEVCDVGNQERVRPLWEAMEPEGDQGTPGRE